MPPEQDPLLSVRRSLRRTAELPRDRMVVPFGALPRSADLDTLSCPERGLSAGRF